MKQWLIFLILSGGMALFAQSTTYYGKNGQVTGRAVTRGNTTTYYDSTGKNTGRAVTSGGRTTYYDMQTFCRFHRGF